VLSVSHELAAATAANMQGWLQAGELGLGLLLSAVIGLEREIRQKSAGCGRTPSSAWAPRCSC
jgi:hypothetical protein